MRCAETFMNKGKIAETNVLPDREVLGKLKNGQWVDANAALRAIGERDDTWRDQGGHRSETKIFNHTPPPLNEEGIHNLSAPIYSKVSSR